MSADMNHETFPSDETLAAFIDGNLDAETRRRVLEHMSACGECRDVVAMAGDFRSASADNVVPIRSRRWMLPAAAAAIAAAILIAILTPIRTWLVPPKPTAIAALVAAAPPYRTFEGRLADFPYHAYRGPTRGPADDDDVDRLPALEAASRLSTAVSAHPTADNHHAFAVALLLAGRSADAMNQIRMALQAQTGESDVQKAIANSADVRLLNDAATIYAAHAAQSDSASDRQLSYAAAERAYKLQPRSPEAAWNRAVAIESLQPTPQAIAAWQEYLTIDQRSKWADDANAHIRTLKSSP